MVERHNIGYLKPCPFCGGEAVRRTVTCGGFDSCEEGVIRCKKCGAQNGKRSSNWKDIEDAWNLRLTTNKEGDKL